MPQAATASLHVTSTACELSAASGALSLAAVTCSTFAVVALLHRPLCGLASLANSPLRNPAARHVRRTALEPKHVHFGAGGFPTPSQSSSSRQSATS